MENKAEKKGEVAFERLGLPHQTPVISGREAEELECGGVDGIPPSIILDHGETWLAQA
jgi:hypothetical protein